MTPRAQLRRLMSDVDQAADRAHVALRRVQAGPDVRCVDAAEVAAPLRHGLILASLLMAAKVLFAQG
ncbi:hypothetical protein H1W37_01210 [Stappia taiwanensis]|uniref:Uncharacterized protein n=1 Tax=Stappia taiwanensis TaxID=992267 RepID=A0A838XTB7_9HYPH|nr:hypothetical protein [Stappia taiwanensis]MBA4610253.1 hypothetical protein [Stappia taiwanensis]GGE78068.1 hypothetical protein GCM10007285_02410 [Stappia taiwanensis]